MTAWAVAVATDLRPALEAVADPVKAPQMAAYMKDRFVFLGVSSPDRDAVLKELLAVHGRPSGPDAIALAQHCWAQPEREFQNLGVRVLRRSVKRLTSDDLDALRVFVQDKSWWDTVDELAGRVVGGLVAADPDLRQVMDAWIEDADFWLARVALIHQLFHKEDTDAERLFAYCERRAADTEFFIRKAIGWALRQYARTNPDAVALFVAEHEDELSGLSKREALKHLA